jgi:GNAT superfamily N-acetyltransferase
MESARLARIEDGERVGALRRDAYQSLIGARGARLMLADRIAHDVAWPSWIGDSRRLAVVGTLDHHVVGYGLAHLAPADQGDSLAVVDEVWVQVEARGVGVGEAVMDAIIEWCLQAGCTGIDGEALPGDRVMKGFFERYGMSARLLIMHRPIGPGPAG